jgi:hypothetical protein
MEFITHCQQHHGARSIQCIARGKFARVRVDGMRKLRAALRIQVDRVSSEDSVAPKDAISSCLLTTPSHRPAPRCCGYTVPHSTADRAPKSRREAEVKGRGAHPGHAPQGQSG